MLNTKKSNYFTAVSLLALACVAPSFAMANDETTVAAATTELAPVESAVIVTGTRTSGVKAVDSASPIVVLDTKALAKVGQPDLMQALAQNTPSFTVQAFGSDTANLTVTAKLRGVSPNHALILVDGKRRHTTANLAVLGGAYQGAATTDWSFIPMASVGRVEILQDGAAAQYGSDAIAGVINIITKKKGDGGLLNISGGQYMDGGGQTGAVSLNMGFTPIEKAYMNLTLESKWHDYSNRGDLDPRVYATNSDGSLKYPNLQYADEYPYLNHVIGDAQYRLNVAMLSAGYDVSDDLKFYTNMSYGHKYASAYENWRTPDRVVTSTGAYVFPFGFQPREVLYEDDYQFTFGSQFKAMGWDFDVSTSAGRDDEEIYTRDSANISFYTDFGWTPSNFYDGSLITTQQATTIDADRSFEVGLASPLNVAWGLEYRNESYEIKSGDAASYYKTGAQSFPGYPTSANGKHSRNNKAVYVDFAVNPVAKLSTDFALRYEDFSDFGEATVGKLTGRYDFTDAFALRGTVSTGFRAPTLAEEFYTSTNVSPDEYDVQVQPNSNAAKLIGIPNGLKPEKSTNLSFGTVLKPFDSNVIITADAYYIKLKDRIVGSDTLYAIDSGVVVSPTLKSVIDATGIVIDYSGLDYLGINVFGNGVDTTTKGIDILATTSTDLDKFGKIDWTFSANYNKTEVDKVHSFPGIPGMELFSKETISYLETATPKYKFILGGLWTYGKLQTNVKVSYYGDSQYDVNYAGQWWEIKPGAKAIVDLDLSYNLTDNVTLSVGANNLFNEYPDEQPAGYRAIRYARKSSGYVTHYPTNSPYGINGGYYYSKLSVKF